MIILIVTSAKVIISQNIRKFEYGCIMNFGAFQNSIFALESHLADKKYVIKNFLVLKIFLAPLLLFFLMHTLHLLYFYSHLNLDGLSIIFKISDWL